MHIRVLPTNHSLKHCKNIAKEATYDDSLMHDGEHVVTRVCGMWVIVQGEAELQKEWLGINLGLWCLRSSSKH